MDANEVRALFDELTRRLGRDLSGLWATDLSSDEFRALIIDAFPELALQYSAAASEIAAEWYDSTPTTSTGYRVTQGDLPSVERLASSAQWALNVGDAVSGLTLLRGVGERAVLDGARETVLANVEAERGALWARHASANACAFCRMLATRGEVYASEASATRVVGRGKDVSTNYDPVTGKRKSGGQAKGVRTRGDQSVGQKLGDKFHDNCHCIATPVRPGETYKPPAYVAEWEQQYLEAVKNTPGKGEYGAIDTKAVLAYMTKVGNGR